MGWVYAACAIVALIADPVSKFDDVIPLLHGRLVQQGYTPNIDFYSFYPPLIPYLYAAIFTIFGQTIIAARLLSAVLYVFVLLLAVRFFRLHFGHSGPLAGIAVLLLAAAIGGALKMPFWPGFAFSLAALLTYLCSRSCDGNQLRAVAVSGVLTAAAIFSRVNFGAYIALVVFFDTILHWALKADARQRSPFKDLVRPILVFVVPIIVLCGGFGFVVFRTNIGGAVSEFVFSANRLMLTRGFIPLQLSADMACAVALPPAWFFFRAVQGSSCIPVSAYIAFSVAIAALIVATAGRGRPSVALIVIACEITAVIVLHVAVQRLGRSEFIVLLFFCCTMHYVLSRADWDHWRVIPIGYALLLPLLVRSHSYHEVNATPAAAAQGTALAVLTCVTFIFVTKTDLRPAFVNLPRGFSLLAGFVRHPHQSDADLVATSILPPLQWKSVYTDTDEWQTLRYVLANTSTSDPIFVGAQDHSTLFWNDLRIYWLANRPIGVRRFQLETRIATEPAVQRQIVSDLTQNKVSWIIIDRVQDGDAAFFAAAYKGATLLDEYIKSHFTEQRGFGRYAILRRE